ncbi:uncharacterized protein aus isoform X2 [Calliphora vicina]|uniref:uncharacterized protein aus isoform X2 n=1 Tax=Calliphora vicina TaxID=7373 RepID=UPI00325A7804
MDQPLKNSKHATTSSLEGTTASATTTMTATQMRATLIYLAPFLQPCKNVVTSTTKSTTATATATTTTRAQSMPHQCLGNEQDIATTATATAAVVLQQQTHVARNRLNSSRNNHNNAINSNSTIINNNNNNNINNNSTSSSSRPCCSNTPNTNHKTTATMSCTTECVASKMSSGMSKSSSCSSTTTSSSSCCHNTMQQQESEYQEEKQVKEQNLQQKDKYYKNYEMPALETTTTIKTTTMQYASNNKTRQQTQQQQQQQKEHLKEDRPSSLSKTLLSTSSSSSCSSTLSSPLATSFVNYANNRSTKYLRERGRRNILQQQQQQEQTLKQKTHGSILKQQPPPLALMQQTVRHEVQVQQEVDTEKQQRNLTCGRGPYIAKDHHSNSNNNNNHIKTNNTSVLSRCHCLNNNQHNKNNNSKIMLSNVQDIMQHNQLNIETNRMKTLMYSNNCDDQPDNDADYNDDDDDKVEQDETVYDNHSDAGNIKENIHLRLRKNHHQMQQEQEEDDDNEQNEKNTTHQNSYINYKELLFNTNPKTIKTIQHSHSPSPTTTTQSSSSTTTTTFLTNPSYTTILNKECRCFKQYKRDTIGSECNLEQKNLKIIEGAASPSSSSSASLSDNYCMINTSGVSLSSPTVLDNLWQLLQGDSLASSVGCSQLYKTVAVSKWLFMWLLFVMLSTSAHGWAGRNDVPTNCTFPARWEGSWFLSGYQQSIHIKGSQFSYRGRCAASDGNKYLIVDEKGCHRCLVIYEKHNNVLQYKESECEGDSMYMHQTNPSAMAMRSVLNQKTNNNGGDHRGGAHPNLNGHSRLSSSDQYIMRSNDDMNDYFCKGRETLQNLCDQIPGDALLYSLFRESAEPVKCPLKGPFIFTYNRGNGECKSPVSNIESCTEDSRLLLSFQACPDVVGTESTVEELTCLATWKDGNSRYLVGLVSHHHAISNEERYRCFVYEKISSLMDLGHFAGPSMSTSKDAEYKLAQSGDATCNGLDSAEVGSRIMSLRKPPVTERCDFPVWFKGPRHWHVLMGNAVYNYHSNDGSIHIIKPNGYMETRALCEQINKQTSTEMMSVVHYTTGCQSGFMCMMFYRRDTHVIEIQTGKPASRLEDACAPDHFDINKTPYITLLASNPDPQICPMEGLYSLRGAIGPPYLTTRHKRNHNKVHGLHNHHHQYEGPGGREYLHKRHSSLSFRNSQHDEKNAWHSNTRGLPIRSRRDASSTVTPLATSDTNQTQAAKTTQEILVVGNSTNVGFVQNPGSDTRLRSRRNVPECVTNYKAQRQLWVGCTEANVIDVRPLCNDEGDEEYSCHGSWSENSTVYIIARHKGTKHGVCISYRPTEGTSAKLVVGDACYRGTLKPPEHHLVANLSIFGKCGETGSHSPTMPVVSWFNLLLATILITFLSQLPIQR